jgi:uncharacterized YccA/Bax inhibitor family protein
MYIGTFGSKWHMYFIIRKNKVRVTKRFDKMAQKTDQNVAQLKFVKMFTFIQLKFHDRA